MAHGQLSDFIVVGTGYARSPKDISLSRNADGTMARRCGSLAWLSTQDYGRLHAPYSLVSTKRRTCLSHSDLCPHCSTVVCTLEDIPYFWCSARLCRAVPQQPAREALRAEIIRPLADLGWTFRAIMMRYRCLRAQKDGAWCVRTNEGGRRQSARAPPGVWYVATGRLPPLVPPSRERTGGGLTSSYNAMADGLGLLSVPSLSRSGRRKATRSGILLFSLSGIPSSSSLRRSPAICCFHDVHV